MENAENEIIGKLDEMINNGEIEDDLVLYLFKSRKITNNIISLPVLKYLIEKVPTVDINYIFTTCCKDNDVNKLSYLMDNYNININNKWAMLLAIQKNNIDIIKFLVMSGFNIELHKDDIFFEIVLRQNETVLKYFLEQGLVPDEKHILYSMRKPIIIQTYLDYGMDPQMIMRLFLKYLSVTQYSLLECLKILSTHGLNLNENVNNYD